MSIRRPDFVLILFIAFALGAGLTSLSVSSSESKPSAKVSEHILR